MANPEHLALLWQGVEAWNQWRQANPGIEPELSGADLSEANLSRVNLGRASLHGGDLRRAKLGKAHLYKANLSEVDLSGANLSGANLHGANLFKAILLDAILRGTVLSEANLRRAVLVGANLSEVSLREMLSFDDLPPYRYKADYIRVNPIEGILYGAPNMGVVLREADLSEADLRLANLRLADFHGADLSEAILEGTTFVYVNLAQAKGLDTCHHRGPSFLDFSTLQRSGPLSLTFLRGCGLPDLLIDYLPALLNQPIQYYSCFISYSSRDEDFAQRLYADLQNKGVRCWFASEDIKRGQKIYEQIGEAIRLHDKLLLVLSEHSMNSEWVKTEIAEARQREVREKRQVLFPIGLVAYEKIKQWKCFDADTGKDSAREIRKYFIPDFSNWKSHDAYQPAFDRLLRDLKPALERKPETS